MQQTPALETTNPAIAAAPDDLRNAIAASLDAWPDALAAVLFGSRARGDHRADSDWDVAFVTQSGARVGALPPGPQATMASMFRDAQCLALPQRIAQKTALSIDNVGRAVVRDGILLAGRWDRPDCKGKLAMDEKEYFNHLESVYRNLAHAGGEIGKIGRAGRNLFSDGLHCNAFVESSADAAEHLAKAILGREGIDFKRVHDVAHLADQAEADGRADLAAALRPLNDTTKKDHTAHYGIDAVNADDCNRAAQRFLGVATLLKKELHESASQTLSIENLSASIANMLEWVDESRVAMARAIRRTQSTSGTDFDRERVGALLDWRDELINTLEQLSDSFPDETRTASRESSSDWLKRLLPNRS